MTDQLFLSHFLSRLSACKNPRNSWDDRSSMLLSPRYNRTDIKVAFNMHFRAMLRILPVVPSFSFHGRFQGLSYSKEILVVLSSCCLSKQGIATKAL